MCIPHGHFSPSERTHIMSMESAHMCVMFSQVRLSSPWAIAHQAPLYMEFSQQEYWSGLFPTPGDLSYPGIKPTSLTSALACRFFTTWETMGCITLNESVYTLPCLGFEFFPVQSQGPSFGAPPRDSLKTWDMTICLSPFSLQHNHVALPLIGLCPRSPPRF